MFLRNYCTEFVILIIIVCISLLSPILPLIIFNFPFVFQDITLFVEIHVYIALLKPVNIDFNKRDCYLEN